MSFSIIRKATEEDETRLLASAERFCSRHNIEFDDDVPALRAIEYHIHDLCHNRYDEDEAAKRLARLWSACASRALRLPTAGPEPYIAYGYVGTEVD